MDRLGGFFGFRDREEDFDDDYVEEDDTDLGDDRPGAKGAQWGLVGLRSMQLEG